MMPPVPKEQQLYEVKSFDNLIDYKRETERTKAPKKVARRVSQWLPFCPGAEGGTLKTLVLIVEARSLYFITLVYHYFYIK